MTTPNIESDRFPTRLENVGGAKNQFGKLAEQVGSIAAAFQRATEQLRQDNRTSVAKVTDSVARRSDQVAHYLSRTDVRGVRQDLEGLTRRQPGLVLCGAVALGLVGARLLKSSDRGHYARPGDPHARA